MSNGSNGLSFRTLRAVNRARLPLFRDAHFRVVHADSLGADWSDAQWLQALVGEIGEYANLKKKVERGDLTEDEARADLARELADVAIYLDILSLRLGIDLGEAVRSKFNETSAKVGAPIFIGEDDNWRDTP